MDAMLTEVTEMNAAVLYGQEDVRIERVPMPRPRGREIVVEVQAALTCGTDLKTYRPRIPRQNAGAAGAIWP